jgi:AraC family transcriptional regulator
VTLSTHGDQKYQGITERLTVTGLPNLQIEHRSVRPGHHEPTICLSNEIVFLLSGRTFNTLSANGLAYRNYYQPGMACIVPMGAFQKASSISSPLETLHIYMPRGLIEQSALADYDIDPAKAELSFAGGLRDPMLYQMAIGFLGLLGREIEPIHRLFVDGLQAAFAGHLLGNYAIDRWRAPAKTPSFDVKRLTRVIDYIEAHFTEEIGLSSLAGVACLSEFHFSRLFRMATGLAPHRYVTLRRVQEAQKQLELHRDSSLVEIALRLGFGSQANFIRVFRKSTGFTPGQYRSRIPPSGKQSGYGGRVRQSPDELLRAI